MPPMKYPKELEIDNPDNYRRGVVRYTPDMDLEDFEDAVYNEEVRPILKRLAITYRKELKDKAAGEYQEQRRGEKSPYMANSEAVSRFVNGSA